MFGNRAAEDWSSDQAPHSQFTPHRGGPCPVDPRERVRILHRDGEETTDYASEYIWVHLGKGFDVIGYRPIDADRHTVH